MNMCKKIQIFLYFDNQFGVKKISYYCPSSNQYNYQNHFCQSFTFQSSTLYILIIGTKLALDEYLYTIFSTDGHNVEDQINCNFIAATKISVVHQYIEVCIYWCYFFPCRKIFLILIIVFLL
ncbi:hypothetical protein WA026_007209 [Henosepilachna vigintioctopunctata]|uniref:Transmembrane protein n=1 Tax=Henosepilachna vigintioctopunctata TaxID=420089 RepID=A0AAW1VC45_9CUCU